MITEPFVLHTPEAGGRVNVWMNEGGVEPGIAGIPWFLSVRVDRHIQQQPRGVQSHSIRRLRLRDLPRPNRDGVSAHKLLRMPIKQGFLRQTAARLMSHWHHLHVLYIKPVYIAWLGFNRPCNGKGPLKEFLTENKPCPHSPAAALNLSSCAGFPCLPLIHHFLSLLSCACPFGIQHYSPSQPPFYHSRSPAFGGTPLHQLCRGGKGEKHLRTEM